MKRSSLITTPLNDWLLPTLLVVFLFVRGGKGLESVFACALFAGALIFAGTMKKQKTDSVPHWLYSLGAGFLLLTILSFAFSTTKNYGLAEVIGTASLFLIGLAVLRGGPKGTWNTVEWFSGIARVITIATIVACVTGIAVYILEAQDRFVGTFFDPRFNTDFWPNAWGEFLLLAWPLALFSFWNSPKLRIPVLALIFGALFLSFSRGSILACIAQIGLLLLLTGVSIKKFDARSILFRLGEVLLIVFLSTALFHGANAVRAQFHTVQSVEEKVTFTASEGNSSINERRDFWLQAAQFTVTKPLLGYGPESFRFVQPTLQNGILATSDHPHNIFLKLSMERGVPATLLFIFILVAAYFFGIRTFWKNQHSALQLATGAALLSVTGVLLHLQIDFNLQFYAIALPFTLLIAFLLQDSRTEHKTHRVQRNVEIILATFLFLFVVFEGRFILISHFGRMAEAAKNPTLALSYFDRTRGSLLPRDLELTRARLLTSIDHDTGALEALEVYQKTNAEDARAWLLKADTLFYQGKLELARESYKEAFVRGKQNLLGSMRGILETSLILRDSPSIRDRHDEFLDLYKDYEMAILQNTHFIALSQSVEEFQRVTALMKKAYTAEAESFDTSLVRVLSHAKEERSRLRARNPGILW